jgi:hypothetical protein
MTNKTCWKDYTFRSRPADPGGSSPSPGRTRGSAAIWLRLQVAYDLARAEAEFAAKIEAEVTPAAA